MEKYFIESPAPTPNGRLHLGHIAGPYLASDIFNRVQRSNGNMTFFCCDLDRNQSYVRCASLENGIEREEFIRKNADNIKNTFSDYEIEFDLFNLYDSEERRQFIINFIKPLFFSEYSEKRTVEFYYDIKKEKFLVEAFISGVCPKCKENVKGGFCEICGYYNFSIDLEKPFSTLNPEMELVKKSCEINVLNIQKIADKIKNIIHDSNMDESIKKTVIDLMNKNTVFPITLPLEDGLSLDSDRTKLSPWIEVLCGIYYMKSIARLFLNCHQYEDMQHVCFSGIDNSFYFTVICNAIRIALGYKDFPKSYYFNHYYTLDEKKFSTSRNHAVWADNVSERFSMDKLRLFLASTYPQLKKFDFSYLSLMQFEKSLDRKGWINKLRVLLPCFLLNSSKTLENRNPNFYADTLCNFLRDENNKPEINLNLLLQALCPSLYNKLNREMGISPQITRSSPNLFRNIQGVNARKIIHIDEANFTLSIASVKNGEKTVPHQHYELDELFYIFEGKGLITLDNREACLESGDSVFIPGGVIHTIKPVDCHGLKFLSIAWRK